MGLFSALGAIVVAVVGVVLFRASYMPSLQMKVELDPADRAFFATIDYQAAVERLAASLRVKTVSREPHVVSSASGFLALHELYETQYPLVHKHLEKTIISDYSLLFHWKGSEPSGTNPGLLMSHLDVVPAAEVDLDRWDFEPFAGHVIRGEKEDGEDSYIYGRGTMDDKIGVTAILEAVEHLLAQGFVPRQDIYLSFGHDEEVGGQDGNAKIAKMFEEQGVRLDYVIDEGGVILSGAVPGLDAPNAAIAVGEKGYASFELVAAADGGHSSMPTYPSSVGILSRALVRLEDERMPPQTSVFFDLTMSYLGPALPFATRLAVANRWLFEGAVVRMLEKTGVGNAQMRTTTAPTMLRASEKDNVLPTQAVGTVNFRIAPGDTVASVKREIERIVGDERVEVRLVDGSEANPSPVSPVDTAQFRVLHETIASLFPECVVSPMVTTGMTDARHYAKVTNNVFRFTPMFLARQDLKRIHGINERVSVADVERSVKFYYAFIKNMQAPRS